METLRCMGEYVIPKLDKDPVHRTTRARDQLKGQPSSTGAARQPSFVQLPASR